MYTVIFSTRQQRFYNTVQEITHVNICRPAYSCIDSIHPPYVYLKAENYKYFPTKVYPDKQQNSPNPDLKKQKNNNKNFFQYRICND